MTWARPGVGALEPTCNHVQNLVTGRLQRKVRGALCAQLARAPRLVPGRGSCWDVPGARTRMAKTAASLLAVGTRLGGARRGSVFLVPVCSSPFEVREGAQGASRVAPGKSGPHKMARAFAEQELATCSRWALLKESCPS